MKIIDHEKQVIEVINDIYKQKNPVMLAMIGQPGSGKTYFVSKLELLLKENGFDVDKIKVHNNYIKPIYSNPGLIKEIMEYTNDSQKTKEILAKIKLNKKNPFSDFRPNFNLPGAFDIDRFIEDLYNLTKGNSITIKEYSPWDQVCTNEIPIIPTNKKVIIIEGPMAVIPESEYEFCNIKDNQIEFYNKIIGNNSIYDLIISVKTDVMTRILRRLRRCLLCPQIKNCHDNTPLSSLEFHEKREKDWISFVENKVKDKVSLLTNPLTKDEIDSMDFYENTIQDSIIFFPKEKGINGNICLKFENNCVEVTINITSPFDNSKKCQSFILGNVNKTKIIEAIEQYFRT